MEAERELEPSPERENAPWLVPLAAAGDAIIFVVFAAIGRASHGDAVGNAALRTVGTALPFLIGWFAAALIWRPYDRDALRAYGSGLRRVAITWITGAIIALTIRSLLEHRIVPATFAAIAVGFNLVLLLIWRTAVVTARHET